MEVNLEVCKTISVQFGLPLQFVVKEFYVFDVLGQITMETARTNDLVFKGGTALNKVYLSKLQRFSEDLDFDAATESITEVRKRAKELASKISGYQIDDEFRRVGDTIQFYCSYDSPLGVKDHVRVELSAKKILSDKSLVIKPAQSEYTGRFVTGFYVYAIEDLVARKMHALCARAEGKDFFDVHNGLPLCGNLEKALEKMLESEGEKETPAEFLEKTVAVVKRADHKKLKRLTNPFIPFSARPKDWLQLKNDLAFKLEAML